MWNVCLKFWMTSVTDADYRNENTTYLILKVHSKILSSQMENILY